MTIYCWSGISIETATPVRYMQIEGGENLFIIVDEDYDQHRTTDTEIFPIEDPDTEYYL